MSSRVLWTQAGSSDIFDYVWDSGPEFFDCLCELFELVTLELTAPLSSAT